MKVNRPVVLIALVFIALSLSYMANTPFLEASDEAAHFLYVHNLLEDRALPVIESREAIAEESDLVKRWSLESHQPPLYYLIGAALISPTQRDDIETYLRPNPLIFLRGTVKDNPNKWLHNPSAPAGDTHIALTILRLYSLALSTTTLFLVYGVAKLTFRSEAFALTTMALVASIPTFIAIGGSVNNDNLVTMLYSAGVFMSLRMWRDGIRPRDIVIVSLILAAVGLTKITGLTLFGIVYAGLLLGVYQRAYSLRQAAVVVASSLILAAVLAGWWYLRNLSLYGDPLAAVATAALWGREFALPSESGSITGEIGRIWRSFWMMVGHLHYPVWTADWFYGMVTVLVGVGMVGLLTPPPSPLPVHKEGESSARWRWFTRIPRLWNKGRLPSSLDEIDSPPLSTVEVGRGSTLLFLLLVCALPITVLLIGTRSIDISYGRLAFPALTGLAPLLVYGLWRWFARFTPLVVLPIAFMAIQVPLTVLPDAYPRLSVVDALPAEVIPVDVSAGELTVLAYQLHTDTAAPGDDIRFSLYLTGTHAGNPALYVTLIDPLTGDELGTTAVYPGTAPMDALENRVIYHAPLKVRLNDTRTPLSPRQVKIQLGWQTALSTEYLPMTTADGTPVEALLLNASTLIDPSYTIVRPQTPVDAVFGDIIRLYGYDVPQTSFQAGDTLNLALYWQPVKPATEDYVVTVQLLDAQNNLIGQDDGDIAGYPTTAWRANVVDLREIVIPDTTPPGTYRLLVGWYRLEDFARLPLPGGENDLFVIPVQVEVIPHGS